VKKLFSVLVLIVLAVGTAHCQRSVAPKGLDASVLPPGELPTEDKNAVPVEKQGDQIKTPMTLTPGG
jgi:hypothetical protein